METGQWIFVIDKLTASLEEVATGRPVATLVIELTKQELKTITKKGG